MSIELSVIDNQEGEMDQFWNNILSSIWKCMPAKVLSVNNDNQTVSLKIMIRGEIRDKDNNTTNVEYPNLNDVPFFILKGGDYLIEVCPAINDEGIVLFADKSPDQWLYTGDVSIPFDNNAYHNISNSIMFISGISSFKNKLSNFTQNGIKIKNKQTNDRIEINNNGVVIHSSTVNIHGNLNVTGDITTNGNITAGTVSLKTHIHSGVTTGGGVSGGPA